MKRRFKLLITFGLLFYAVSPSYSMTTAEILARVRVNIKDQSTIYNRQRFTDATLINFLNDGQREGNILAWLLQDRITLPIVSGTQEYNLPADFLATDRVLFNNVKLDQTSLSKLDTDTVGWAAATGAVPQKYYLYRATSTILGLVPKPLNPTILTLTVYYIKQPLEITSTSQTPWNGWNSLTPYHSALIYYVTYRAFRVMEEPTLADPYYQEWANSIEMMRKGVYTMPDFNPGFSGQRK